MGEEIQIIATIIGCLALFLIMLPFPIYLTYKLKKKEEISSLLSVLETPINTIIIFGLILIANYNVKIVLPIILIFLSAGIIIPFRKYIKKDKYFNNAILFHIMRVIIALVSLLMLSSGNNISTTDSAEASILVALIALLVTFVGQINLIFKIKNKDNKILN